MSVGVYKAILNIQKIYFNLIDRLLSNGSIQSGFAEDAKSMLNKAEPDRKCLERLARNSSKGIEFINGKI
ncbi:hypothetical protein HAX54_001929 [Datura stramonium]|uniref:Uncharacterized protein n=1 Tax=Datura stramonium TaxID=4076 RepID=A0ABS8T4A9_DATST|nr:hypothetical protein [Datura stramonium]